MYVLVNWVLESLMTIIKFTAIKSPRREFSDYRDGDEVMATYQGKQYPAMIIEKSETQASLVSTMDSILDEQRYGGTMESILAKRKEESTSRSPVRRKQTSADKESRENDQPSKKRKLNESKTSTSISTNSDLVEVNICTGTESPIQDMYTAEKNNVLEIQGTDMQKEIKDKACPPQKIAEIFKTPRKDEAINHKDCVSRKEFSELKDEVKRLRRKVREMEQRTNSTPDLPALPTLDLTPTSSSPASSVAASPSVSQPATPTSSNSATPVSQSPTNVDTSLFNGHTYDTLTDSISHIDNLYNAVRILLLKLFPEEYIISHSVTGKASNSKTERKPPYDFRLFGTLLKIIKNKFGATSKEVTEKVHSVQKSILKSKKQNK